MELNGVEKCSVCGITFETLANDTQTSVKGPVKKWPWYAVIYLIKSETVVLKCGGTLIQSKAVITAGKYVKNNFLTSHI